MPRVEQRRTLEASSGRDPGVGLEGHGKGREARLRGSLDLRPPEEAGVEVVPPQLQEETAEKMGCEADRQG